MVSVTWKSIGSSGWEYFILCEDLGSSPMYVNFCVIVLLFKSVKSCSGMI